MAMTDLSILDTAFADLGLVDPDSGKATTPPNWGKEPEADRDADIGIEDPESVVTRTAEEPKANQWDTDENPYKKQFDELVAKGVVEPDPIRAEYNAKVRDLEQKANEAFIHFSSLKDAEGKPVYDPRALHAQIGVMLDGLIAQAKNEAYQAVMKPTAVRHVAEDIVKKVGGGVTIDDIITLPDPQSMMAAAKAIAKRTNGDRDSKFEARRASGVDNAESAKTLSRAVPQSYETLSPHQKIKYGILRGDR